MINKDLITFGSPWAAVQDTSPKALLTPLKVKMLHSEHEHTPIGTLNSPLKLSQKQRRVSLGAKLHAQGF